MVLLGLICISFLGVRFSCLYMFFIFVNGEKVIPYFNLVFLLFFWFFLFWEERDKMNVKRLIYPSFLTEAGYREVTDRITGE